VIIWDLHTLAPITTTVIDGNEVAFSPDERILASASTGNAVVLWDIHRQATSDLPATAALPAYLCAKAGRDLTAEER